MLLRRLRYLTTKLPGRPHRSPFVRHFPQKNGNSRMEQGNSFSLVLPGISFSLRRLCCVVVDDLVRKKLLLSFLLFFFPLISIFPSYRFDSKRSQSCHFLKSPSPRPTDKVNLICLFSQFRFVSPNFHLN